MARAIAWAVVSLKVSSMMLKLGAEVRATKTDDPPAGSVKMAAEPPRPEAGVVSDKDTWPSVFLSGVPAGKRLTSRASWPPTL